MTPALAMALRKESSVLGATGRGGAGLNDESYPSRQDLGSKSAGGMPSTNPSGAAASKPSSGQDNISGVKGDQDTQMAAVVRYRSDIAVLRTTRGAIAKNRQEKGKLLMSIRRAEASTLSVRSSILREEEAMSRRERAARAKRVARWEANPAERGNPKILEAREVVERLQREPEMAKYKAKKRSALRRLEQTKGEKGFYEKQLYDMDKKILCLRVEERQRLLMVSDTSWLLQWIESSTG